MGKRKYPVSMFIMGVVLNLIKSWYVFILVIISFLTCIFFYRALVIVPVVLIFVWFTVAIIKQLQYGKAALNFNGDEETNALFNKMFADNSRGYENVIDIVAESIEKNQGEPDQ